MNNKTDKFACFMYWVIVFSAFMLFGAVLMGGGHV